MSDDSIEIEEIEDVEVVVDDDGEVLGAVVDDLVVATGPDGSIVDETVAVLDDEGNLIAVDEIVSAYDADGNLVGVEETIAVLDE